MIKIVVASGKGGTGKTTIAVNLALAIENDPVQFLDCDVEEPNAHLFLKPVFYEEETIGIPVPSVDLSLCSFCGRCSEVCAFNAIAILKDQLMLLPELCHGCGSCAYLCPENAITEVDRPIGIVESGTAGKILLSHGRLNPGEAMSPPLINAVKGKTDTSKITIIDAPPGTSCPVVSAVKCCDFCILVTEPTPFGLNDLDLAFQMACKLEVPAGVVINRCDLGDQQVEEYCQANNIPVMLKIPWDLELARLYARGEPAALHLTNWRTYFAKLYKTIMVLKKEGLSR